MTNFLRKEEAVAATEMKCGTAEMVYGRDTVGAENHCNFRLNGIKRFDISLYGKIGYRFLFENKNTFGIDIIGSYAFEPYAQGLYFVGKNGLDEEGIASLRNMFIGLQFSYGFTMKKLLCNP